MQTSARGTSDGPLPVGRIVPIECRGFTLFEVLVVLAIIGVVASGVSIGVDALRGRDVGLALERLQWVLEASAERARTRGQPIAFELLEDGYRFSVLDPDGRWYSLDEPPVFSERVLPDTMRWGALRTDSGNADRIVFGNRAPRFELTVHTPVGFARLSGGISGAVKLDRGTSGTT